MRASRLLSILILLQMRGRVSADALADEFEVSVRTIYRDIDHLSAAGVPVYAERGRNGGFALEGGYRTRLTGLSASEAEALAFAGIPSAAGELGLGEALSAAQLKLFAALPEDAGASAARVAAKFHVDPMPWYSRAAPAGDALPAVASALWREKKIRVHYESWRGLSERTLSPFGLVLKAGHWYLVAKDDAKKSARTFRVAAIRAFEVLDEPAAAPPRRFRLADHWADAARDFEASLKKDVAALRVTEQGFRALFRLGAHIGEAAEASRREDERPGWSRVEIPIESARQAACDLRRLGAEVEAVSPKELREEIKADALKVAALYETPPAHKKRTRKKRAAK